MQSTLAERLVAWVTLFQTRKDLEFSSVKLVPATSRANAAYPDDAAALAQVIAHLHFSWKLIEENEYCGFLYLDLHSPVESMSFELDGKFEEKSDLYSFDADGEGTGMAAWLFAPKSGPSRVFRNVENTLVFASVTDYLTLGAKRAFVYSPETWQSFDESDRPIWFSDYCAPRRTPVEKLQRRLVDRGATPEMARDLCEWLGADVSLLLPKK